MSGLDLVFIAKDEDGTVRDIEVGGLPGLAVFEGAPSGRGRLSQKPERKPCEELAAQKAKVLGS